MKCFNPKEEETIEKFVVRASEHAQQTGDVLVAFFIRARFVINPGDTPDMVNRSFVNAWNKGSMLMY